VTVLFQSSLGSPHLNVGSCLVLTSDKHGTVQCVCVHHSRLEEFIVLSPALVEGEEEDDQWAEETHSRLENRSEENAVCMCVRVCVCVVPMGGDRECIHCTLSVFSPYGG